jgi:hypothetical protein
MNLNMLSDFMHVININRKHYTKNKYFPKHFLFSTTYLLHKQKLNHGNYSEQDINMGNFVHTSEYDVHMYTKFQDVCKYRYFYRNLTLFCLFSIYIIYYYETILIWQCYVRPNIMGIFMELEDVMGVTYPKFSPSTC